MWQVLVAISKTGSGYEKGYKKRTDFNLEQWKAAWMGNKNRTDINLEKWNATQGGTKREHLQFMLKRKSQFKEIHFVFDQQIQKPYWQRTEVFVKGVFIVKEIENLFVEG